MFPAFLLLRSVYFGAASGNKAVQFAFRVEVANLGDAAGGFAAYEEDGELDGVCEAVEERGENGFVSWRRRKRKMWIVSRNSGWGTLKMEMERTSLVNLDVYG